MAVGNTFGATALSSYGGFWISFAIILTPGGFAIGDAYTDKNDFNHAIGFYLAGWFIFTTILLICTLRSTVAFFLLFFTLDLAFLFLTIGHLQLQDAGVGKPKTTQVGCIKAGGVFGLLAAFLAWYNALAGIADTRYVIFLYLSPRFFGCAQVILTYPPSNSFFIIPVAHFPWSDKGREERAPKTERETV